MRIGRALAVLSLMFATVACGSETIVHRLGEREANKIIEVLAEQDIRARKGMIDTGREIFFTISVSPGDKLNAIRLLNKYELPRRADKGYEETYGGEGGLIPTNTEERAKFLASIEGEIQKQLKLIDGILDAQVQIVLPEENALRTNTGQEPQTTASVTVKYMPSADGSKPLSEPQIQGLVAAGVEKLSSDKVVVVMTRAGPPAKASASQQRPAGNTIWTKWPAKTLNLLAITVVMFILLLAVGVIFQHIRLRTVRGRLIRLQTEIARARRKPGESAPAG